MCTDYCLNRQGEQFFDVPKQVAWDLALRPMAFVEKYGSLKPVVLELTEKMLSLLDEAC
jgi:hypothetical protein